MAAVAIGDVYVHLHVYTYVFIDLCVCSPKGILPNEFLPYVLKQGLWLKERTCPVSALQWRIADASRAHFWCRCWRSVHMLILIWQMLSHLHSLCLSLNNQNVFYNPRKFPYLLFTWLTYLQKFFWSPFWIESLCDILHVLLSWR